MCVTHWGWMVTKFIVQSVKILLSSWNVDAKPDSRPVQPAAVSLVLVYVWHFIVHDFLNNFHLLCKWKLCLMFFLSFFLGNRKCVSKHKGKTVHMSCTLWMADDLWVLTRQFTDFLFLHSKYSLCLTGTPIAINYHMKESHSCCDIKYRGLFWKVHT